MGDRRELRTFSTAAQAPDCAAALWRRYMAEVYYDLDIRPRGGRHISGTIHDVGIGAVSLSTVHVEHASHAVRRKAAAIADGVEQCFLLLPRTGSFGLKQGRQVETVAPGDAMLVNAAEAYEGYVPEQSTYTTIKLPCHLIRSRLPWVHDACGRTGAVDRDLVPIAIRLVDDVMRLRGSEGSSHLEDSLVALTIALVASSRRDKEGLRSDDLSQLLMTDMRRHMQRHLGDPGLSLAQVAGAAGIAVRTAQRLFRHQDTTFSRELMATRLQQADRILRTDLAGRLSIGEVAYACGFVSQAHFTNRFRTMYGRTPRDVHSTDRSWFQGR